MTIDRNDPLLQEHHEDGYLKGQQKAYLTLSAEERAKGFVCPVRRTYLHLACGTTTTMGIDLAETLAREPTFYNGMFCVHCKGHFSCGPNGEFTWLNDGSKVGT